MNTNAKKIKYVLWVCERDPAELKLFLMVIFTGLEIEILNG